MGNDSRRVVSLWGRVVLDQWGDAVVLRRGPCALVGCSGTTRSHFPFLKWRGARRRATRWLSIATSFSGRKSGYVLSVCWGDLCLYYLILLFFPAHSRQSGVYVFSSRPFGPVEEEGGLELTRTASQHGRVSKENECRAAVPSSPKPRRIIRRK